jgi:hypothetical protein
MKPQLSSVSDPAPEFMLSEYEQLHMLKMAEDKQAEQRVSIFLAITSAAVGAIAILSQIASMPTDLMVVVSQLALIALFLLGLLMINRLATGDLQLMAYHKLFLQIQDYFAKHDGEVATYIALKRKLLMPPRRKSAASLTISRGLRGSISILMILSDSFVGGALVMVTLLGAGMRRSAGGRRRKTMDGGPRTIMHASLVCLYAPGYRHPSSINIFHYKPSRKPDDFV